MRPAMVDLQPGGLEIEPCSVAPKAPGREQQHLGGDMAPIPELGGDAAILAPPRSRLTAAPRPQRATLRSRSSCMKLVD